MSIYFAYDASASHFSPISFFLYGKEVSSLEREQVCVSSWYICWLVHLVDTFITIHLKVKESKEDTLACMTAIGFMADLVCIGSVMSLDSSFFKEEFLLAWKSGHTPTEWWRSNQFGCIIEIQAYHAWCMGILNCRLSTSLFKHMTHMCV